MTDREEWRPEQCPVCGDPYENVYDAEEDRESESGESVCVDDDAAYVHADGSD